MKNKNARIIKIDLFYRLSIINLILASITDHLIIIREFFDRFYLKSVMHNMFDAYKYSKIWIVKCYLTTGITILIILLANYQIIN